jgi:hypothetical protein
VRLERAEWIWRRDGLKVPQKQTKRKSSGSTTDGVTPADGESQSRLADDQISFNMFNLTPSPQPMSKTAPVGLCLRIYSAIKEYRESSPILA